MYIYIYIYIHLYIYIYRYIYRANACLRAKLTTASRFDLASVSARCSTEARDGLGCLEARG